MTKTTTRTDPADEQVVIDPAELDSIEPVSDEDVDQAEREATEAEQLAAALEQRVVNGDDSVTPEQIDSQRSLSRFARLRVAATRRKATRAKAAARMRELAELRDQVLDQASGGPASRDAVASALSGVDKAVAKFLDVAEQHNTWHAEIRGKLRELVGAEEFDGTIYRYGVDDAAALAYSDRPSFREPAHITANGERIEDVDTATLLVAAVYQAAAKYPHLRMEGGYGTELVTYLNGMFNDPAAFFAEVREQLPATSRRK